MDTKSLFEKHDWTGQFFLPFRHEKGFAGSLSYEPDQGLVLSYTTLHGSNLNGGDTLYGFLNTGHPCTLVGNFKVGTRLPTLRHSVQSFPIRTGVMYMLVGDFWTPDQKVFELEFTLTSLQEFFYPEDHQKRVPFSIAPIFEIATKYGAVSVRADAIFHGFDKELRAVYSRDSAALEDLRQAVAGVAAKHPKAMFLDREDLRYVFNLKFTDGATVNEAYKHVSDIAALLAVLTSNPVHPDSLTVIKVGERREELPVYPTLGLTSDTVSMCRRRVWHHALPLSASTISLQDIIPKWLATPNHFRILVSSIQHESGSRDLHSVHGELVLYATQLESISVAAGKHGEKYEFPLATYASQSVQADLLACLSAPDLAELGKRIGDLRNEIAHVGRPQKLLPNLRLKDLVRIAHNMQLVLLGYVLAALDIPDTLVAKYQTACAPRAD